MGLPMSDPIASETSDDDWRRDLAIKLVWAFVVKLALLTLLWFLFFRGSPS
jgi:hypothetical protein